MNDETADVLERAADLLWVRGRARYEGEDDAGQLCPLGAFCVLTGEDADEWPGFRAPVVTAFGQWLRDHSDAWTHIPDRRFRVEHYAFDSLVYSWNDWTDDDELVIDTLRRCAKDVRARG